MKHRYRTYLIFRTVLPAILTMMLMACGAASAANVVPTGSVIANETKEDGGTENDVIRIQLKWLHQFQFSGIYAALEEGYYEAEGLNVEIIEGWPAINVVDEVVKGNADYGLWTAQLLQARMEGKPVTALGAIFQHSPLALAVHPQGGINTPKDLARKRIQYEPQRDVEVTALLRQNGLTVNDVIQLPHTWNTSSFALGMTDAMTVYRTSQVFTLHNKNIPFRLLIPEQHGVDLYGDCLFTTEKEALTHPDRVAAFMRATFKGYEYALNNPEAVISLITTKYNTQLDPDYLRNESRAMRQLMEFETLPVGHMSIERWRHISDIFYQLGMIKEKATTELIKNFMFSFSPAAVQQNPNTPLSQLPNYPLLLWLPFGIVCLLLGYFIMKTRKLTTMLTHRDNKLADLSSRLSTNEERLDLALRGTNDGLWDWNLQTGEVHYSPRWKEIIGFDDHELGNKLEEFESRLHPEDAPLVHKHTSEYLSGKRSHYNIELRMRNKQGTWTSILSRGFAVRDKNGIPVRFVGTHHDITAAKRTEEEIRNLNMTLEQRVQMRTRELEDANRTLSQEMQARLLAEEALRESEARLKAMLRATNDGMVAIDQNGRVTFWNPAAEAMFGYSRQDIMGQPVHDILPPPELRDTARSSFKNFKETGETHLSGTTRRIMAMHKNGNTFEVELSIATYSVDGKRMAVANIHKLYSDGAGTRPDSQPYPTVNTTVQTQTDGSPLNDAATTDVDHSTDIDHSDDVDTSGSNKNDQ